MDNLTASQHERVRNLVRRSPAFIGMRVVMHEDHVEVVSPEELEIGLGPVLEAVEGAPQDQWPTLVDDCLARLLRAITDDSDADGPTDQLLHRIYARLRPVRDSPTEWWQYANEVAPGLLMVLALDHPEHIGILNDKQVAQHGYERLLEAGLDNLCTQLPDEFAMSDEVYIVSGGDYVASMALVIPFVVHAATGIADLPNGVLVAVPDHNTLIFHPITDATGTHNALSEMARLTTECHEDARSPLSQNVHWWQPGSGYLDPVAHTSADTATIGADLVTSYPPDFANLLAELNARR